jgi:hypothetical protein
MSGLEGVVAAVIDAHTPTGYEGSVTCWCDQKFDSWAGHALHVAALVVQALEAAGFTIMRPITAEEEAENVW